MLQQNFNINLRSSLSYSKKHVRVNFVAPESFGTSRNVALVIATSSFPPALPFSMIFEKVLAKLSCWCFFSKIFGHQSGRNCFKKYWLVVSTHFSQIGHLLPGRGANEQNFETTNQNMFDPLEESGF